MNAMKVKVRTIRELNQLLDRNMKDEIDNSLGSIHSLNSIEHIIQNEPYIRYNECQAINKVLSTWNLQVRVERCENCTVNNRLRKPFLRETGYFRRKCSRCRFHEIIESDEEDL